MRNAVTTHSSFITSSFGQEVEIACGAQRAVAAEVGGGLRSYTLGGCDLLDGYRADEMSSIAF